MAENGDNESGSDSSDGPGGYHEPITDDELVDDRLEDTAIGARIRVFWFDRDANTESES